LKGEVQSNTQENGWLDVCADKEVKGGEEDKEFCIVGGWDQ